jgi:uncharacterized protein YbcC (UPF0753/DUF2309 family)/NADH:ubiquinone oxidoreductase subunit 5 (subunit L)/multisubunit Na+/H+ antiporter MnhA subunit
MESPLALVTLLGPLALMGAAALAWRDRSPRARTALGATRAATLAAVLVAVAVLALAAFGEAKVSPLLGLAGLGFSVRIDALSAVMFALVATLGTFITEFSRNYLAGDRRQAVFMGDLMLTLACVLGLVVAGNLVQLTVLWSASSLALHRLLLFYRERPGAVVAARKKFVVARAGDVCLAIATGLLVHAFGTADIGALAAAAAEAPTRIEVQVAALLIGLTAFLKAAQFPAHGWLVEMQETPTPVSALLHAGILNGGTFLVVRLATVVRSSEPTLALLVVVGGFSAIFASVVMVTDARVKATLAYSSAAHMGFMLLLCGIGAYTVAIAHLVAHSFYKAHAFLSSGSAVDLARAARVPSSAKKVGLGRFVVALASASALVLGIGGLMGFDVRASFTNAALAAVMVLPLAHLIAQGLVGTPSPKLALRIAFGSALTALSFYSLERFGGAFLEHAVASPPPATGTLAAIVLAMLGAFAVVTLAQLVRPGSALGSRLWVLARNGLYGNVQFDRLVGAGRVTVAKPTLTSTAPTSAAPASPEAIDAAVARLTHEVAPVWPLESFVAVNPFHALADRPFAEAAQVVARTTGARMTMPRSFYLDALAAGRFTEKHLTEAASCMNLPNVLNRVRQAPAETPSLVPSVTDVVTQLTGRDWTRTMVERIGAWAATYFDEGQASWPSPWKNEAPWAAFRAEAALDRTPELLGATGFRRFIAQLPTDATTAIRQALTRLSVPEAALDLYVGRLLASIGGWAAFARQKVWERELRGGESAVLVEVLAVRLAWEVALLESFAARGAEEAWANARADLRPAASNDEDLALDLALQRAYEAAWQERLVKDLATDAPAREPTRPSAQAAFCIDVRSEVYRRALEAADPDCETIGFAGFFGFPVEYVPLGHGHGDAQCPVLLTPKAVVRESVVGAAKEAASEVATARILDRRARNAWKSFKSSAIACFGFVGPVGLAYLPKLVTDTLGLTRTVPHPSHDGIAANVALGPDLTPHVHEGRRVGLMLDERIAMAEGLLRGMSLTSGFARLVLLTGHGSTTVNNPHAAGLDCGACGGHTGEANARIAAMVVNEPAVRAALAERGIAIPDDTVFLAGLHDTTTDEVTIFDRHAIPASHAADLERLTARLAAASTLARRERAPLLGEDPKNPNVDRRILQRSRDWAQVRPEWGLAGCAAFVVAPRSRTAGKDLGGRAFLHSYDWRKDEGFGVLELVMTAPMVVGSWINLQYYASTVDNRVWGCGNKVLHNVVGTVGVLEGNGGDLRVGLPMQSIHDGKRFVHEPMRLNVLIEAPIEALNGILEKHPSVKALVDNGWLHLYALDDEGVVSHRYAGDLKWEPMATPRWREAA